jgi:hypothetical protein
LEISEAMAAAWDIKIRLKSPPPGSSTLFYIEKCEKKREEQKRGVSFLFLFFF